MQVPCVWGLGLAANSSHVSEVCMRSVFALLALSLILVAAGCGGGGPNPTTSTPTTTTPPGAAGSAAALVPASIKSKGTITVAEDASYAPNEFIGSDGKTVVGMDADLAK